MEGDLTVRVLRELRDEIRQTNARVERVERRQTESELRIFSGLLAVADAVYELREDRRLRATVDDHEHRIGALEKARGPTKH